MEREQYAVMARRETRHWWYAGMRRVALAVLDNALDGRNGLQVLDAGCGTGGTTTELRRFGNVVGIDLAWEALEPARQRGLDLRKVGSGNLGAANVLRASGAMAGVVVAILDIGKGVASVLMAEQLSDGLALPALPAGHR